MGTSEPRKKAKKNNPQEGGSPERLRKKYNLAAQREGEQPTIYT